MDLSSPSTQLLYTTVPVQTHRDEGKDQIGTGFFYSVQTDQEETTVPLILTNRHVVEDADSATLQFTFSDEEGSPTTESLSVGISSDRLEAFQTPELDLVALPVGDILNELSSQGHNIFFRSVTQDLVPDEEALTDLSAIEDVTFIGYPSGLMDEANLTPIVRRGITATAVWNDYKGSRAFLIDAGVYPGSSGSPVFIFNRGSYTTSDGGLAVGNRLLFLGAISETMIHQESTFSQAYLGLGKVIRADAISKYIQDVSNHLLGVN